MRLVGQHDHVGPITEHLRRLEFVDEGEDIAVVAAQQFTQVGATCGVALVALGLADCTGSLEGLGDLVVQFDAISDHHEGPVARHPAQYLLRKEHHREALAAALGLPEHARAAMAPLAGFEHRGNGVVYAEELVVLPEHLHQPRFVLGEQREVFDQVEQARTIAGAAQHHLQRHPARLILARDAFPLEKALPISGE